MSDFTKSVLTILAGAIVLGFVLMLAPRPGEADKHDTYYNKCTPIYDTRGLPKAYRCIKIPLNPTETH